MTVNKMKTGSVLQEDAAPKYEDIRNSLSAAALKLAVLDHLIYSVGRILEITPEKSYYKALALRACPKISYTTSVSQLPW